MSDSSSSQSSNTIMNMHKSIHPRGGGGDQGGGEEPVDGQGEEVEEGAKGCTWYSCCAAAGGSGQGTNIATAKEKGNGGFNQKDGPRATVKFSSSTGGSHVVFRKRGSEKTSTETREFLEMSDSSSSQSSNTIMNMHKSIHPRGGGGDQGGGEEPVDGQGEEVEEGAKGCTWYSCCAAAGGSGQGTNIATAKEKGNGGFNQKDGPRATVKFSSSTGGSHVVFRKRGSEKTSTETREFLEMSDSSSSQSSNTIMNMHKSIHPRGGGGDQGGGEEPVDGQGEEVEEGAKGCTWYSCCAAAGGSGQGTDIATAKEKGNGGFNQKDGPRATVKFSSSTGGSHVVFRKRGSEKTSTETREFLEMSDSSSSQSSNTIMNMHKSIHPRGGGGDQGGGEEPVDGQGEEVEEGAKGCTWYSCCAAAGGSGQGTNIATAKEKGNGGFNQKDGPRATVKFSSSTGGSHVVFRKRGSEKTSTETREFLEMSDSSSSQSSNTIMNMHKSIHPRGGGGDQGGGEEPVDGQGEEVEEGAKGCTWYSCCAAAGGSGQGTNIATAKEKGNGGFNQKDGPRATVKFSSSTGGSHVVFRKRGSEKTSTETREFLEMSDSSSSQSSNTIMNMHKSIHPRGGGGDQGGGEEPVDGQGEEVEEGAKGCTWYSCCAAAGGSGQGTNIATAKEKGNGGFNQKDGPRATVKFSSSTGGSSARPSF
ncbi:fibrinogen alpha-1 chain-like [Pecten maximus]|uniref:fibrinogen alpha-1 chain-like n=1 Tax=Pecten maximus TaxID=6579 RepID=UPI001458466F|nr:fibrinogen alpha-1 chain-like [Pecten maximus]